jgi:CubicO group peptidase (beta-lactamase class C family)
VRTSPWGSGPARKARSFISRRLALTGFVIAAACGGARRIAAAGAAGNELGPGFSPSGPNAAYYGENEAYPVADRSLARQPGEPYQIKYRVGAYSHFDQIFPAHRIRHAATPWMFRRTTTEIRYSFDGNRSSIGEYLSRNPVTGLLIAKDEQILVEHYQYGRTDRDRLISQSMAKSITSLLVGVALGDGAITSVDDPAEAYVPGFEGSEYGKTPLRDLLHMSSGVEFGELRAGQRDLNRLWVDMVWGSGPTKGTINSIIQFNRRLAPPGTQYFYASIEPDVVGVVVRHATKRSLSAYLEEKLWQPIGAEADATWAIDAEGFEIAHGFFNAVLRDYARLARLLAHDGAWEGNQIIPAQYLIDATTRRPADTHLAPGKATPNLGYGYFIWLLPGARRQFALLGANGQRIIVDPRAKLILVQLAVGETDEVWRLWAALLTQFGSG